MKFKKQAGIGILGLAVLVAISGSAFAKNSGHVSLSQSVNLNGTQLAAGEYHLTWQTHSPEATVTFKGKHGAESTAEGKVVERTNRYENDSVVYADNPDGSKTILEIRFAGSNKVLTFGEAAASSEVAAPHARKNQTSTANGSAPQMRPVRRNVQQGLAFDPYIWQSLHQSQQINSPSSGRQPIRQ